MVYLRSDKASARCKVQYVLWAAVASFVTHDLVQCYSSQEKVTCFFLGSSSSQDHAGQPCSAGLAPVSPAAVGCSCNLGPWHQFPQQQRHADYGSLTAVCMCIGWQAGMKSCCSCCNSMPHVMMRDKVCQSLQQNLLLIQHTVKMYNLACTI